MKRLLEARCHGPTVGRTLGLATAGLVALLGFGIPTASAAGAGGLTVEGGSTARTVNLRACTPSGDAPRDPARALAAGRCPKEQGGKGPRPYLSGEHTLLVTNAGSTAPLTVRYLPDGRNAAIPLPGHSNLVALEATHRSLRELRTGAIRPLLFRFMLAPGRAPRAIDGQIQLSLAGASVVVPVTGAIRGFKGLAVRPTSLTMNTDKRTEEVTLAGPDLIEFLRSGGFRDPATLLHDGAGHSTEVRLKLPGASSVARSPEPDRAQATLELTGAHPHAGKYTGTLPISDLTPDAPTIDVELHAHWSFWWFVGLAFLGVLFGGFVRRLVALAGRRSLLTRVLDQSLEAYESVRCSGSTASWNLNDLLDGPPFEPSSARLQGVPGLKASISSARSTKDLDEDSDRVLEMVRRIQRWLRLEPAARRLVQVAKEAPTRDLNGHQWRSSKTSRDTQILLELAKREPPDADAADELVARLLRQAVWHHRFREAWNSVEPADVGRLLTLDGSLGDDAAVENRKPAEQDSLDEQLAISDVNFTEIKPPRETSGPGITPVKWDASPNLFTGWATLDAQSFGQLTRQATTSARASDRPRFWAEVRALRWPDLFWTLVALALACIAYSLITYNDTWGSASDLASAFLAGLLGHITVNWAALPAFQSLRLRASKADSG